MTVLDTGPQVSHPISKRRPLESKWLDMRFAFVQYHYVQAVPAPREVLELLDAGPGPAPRGANLGGAEAAPSLPPPPPSFGAQRLNQECESPDAEPPLHLKEEQGESADGDSSDAEPPLPQNEEQGAESVWRRCGCDVL